MFDQTLQVLLWLDMNATQSEFSTSVQFMDVNELIGSLETEAVFNHLSKVVEKADLLRYEVFLENSPHPPTQKKVLGCVQIWRNIP